jgi:hypothetical protein
MYYILLDLGLNEDFCHDVLSGSFTVVVLPGVAKKGRAGVALPALFRRLDR